MALRDIEPFLNMSHAYSATLNGYSPVLSAYNVPFMIYSGDSNNYPRLASLELQPDGWLLYSSTGSVSGQRFASFGRPFSSMGITFTADSVVYGGVRMKLGRSIPTNLIVMQYVAAVAILPSSQVPNIKVDTEYYLEWCLDLPNNVIRTRVDGVEQVPVALPAGGRSALLGNTTQMLCYGSWLTGSSSALDIYVKDGYILEKTPDGLMSGWLGPQIVRSLPVSEVTGPWTASSGTPKDALNTPITSAATRLAPLVSSDEAASEAVIKFNPASIKGRLNGITVNVAMQKQAGKIGNGEMSLTTNGVESAKTTVVGTADPLMTSRLFVSSKAPDGNNWTVDAINGTTLKIKPVS